MNKINELDLCDPEIRSLFEGKEFSPGMALNAQLIRTINHLIVELRAREKKQDTKKIDKSYRSLPEHPEITKRIKEYAQLNQIQISDSYNKFYSKLSEMMGFNVKELASQNKSSVIQFIADHPDMWKKFVSIQL